MTLGQNLANADTPDYRPQRPARGRFRAAWSDLRRAGAPASRWRGPIPPTWRGAPRPGSGSPASERDRQRYETTPDGNAVILEEQMAKATETALDFQLTSNLYRKYVGMMRIALGTQP